MITTVGPAFSCNWTGSFEDCLVRDLLGEKVTLSTAFKAHIEQVDNWSVSPMFLDRFPDLWGRIRAGQIPVIGQRVPEGYQTG